MSEKLKVVYWSKSQKKNFHKQVSLKKFNGDREKAQEFLNNWKKEQRAKEEGNTLDVVPKDEEKEKPDVEENPPNVDAIVPNVEELKDNAEMPKVQYTKFHLDIPDLKRTGGSTVIYGSSKAGKTAQAIDIIQRYYDGKDMIVIVVSPSIHDGVYDRLRNKKYIKLDRWDDTMIKMIHRIQQKTKNKYAFLIYIDDCILEKLSPQILQLLLVMRNSKISTLLNLQSPTLLSRNGRNNGNNFIFKAFNNDEGREDAIRYFLGSFEPFYSIKKMDTKVKLYKELTRNYNYIYLNALDGIVTFHKADPYKG